MIIVGAPVCEREWILRDWFDGLSHQEDFPPEEIEVVLNYGKSQDLTRMSIIYEQMLGRFRKVTLLEDNTDDHIGHRLWTLSRYATMTRLRNDLLAYVRQETPDFYLSCDTDMLLPPHTLRTLFEHLNTWDGIAPLTFMTPHGEHFPNCMGLTGGRTVPETTTEQHAVFGTVLMTERLYRGADYAPHAQGEDLGWARNVQNAGLRLALCPDVRIKHCMNPEMLETFDVRVGF